MLVYLIDRYGLEGTLYLSVVIPSSTKFARNKAELFLSWLFDVQATCRV